MDAKNNNSNSDAELNNSSAGEQEEQKVQNCLSDYDGDAANNNEDPQPIVAAQSEKKDLLNTHPQ